jgi:hypothetical protein
MPVGASTAVGRETPNTAPQSVLGFSTEFGKSLPQAAFPPATKGSMKLSSDPTRLVFNSLGRGVRRDAPQTRGRKLRKPFTNSPLEREPRFDRHGNTLSEIENMTEKHGPEFKQIVPVVADGLVRAVDLMSSVVPSAYAQRYALYDTSAVPSINMEDYLARVASNTFISPSSMVVALIFLDRVLARHKDLVLNQLNIYKLFFVACRVASKVVEVRTLSNKNFAPVGGVDLRHLNDLESKFLIDIRFDVYVQPSEFIHYCNQILQQCPVVSTVSYVERLRCVTNATRDDEADPQSPLALTRRRTPPDLASIVGLASSPLGGPSLPASTAVSLRQSSGSLVSSTLARSGDHRSPTRRAPSIGRR